MRESTELIGRSNSSLSPISNHGGEKSNSSINIFST